MKFTKQDGLLIIVGVLVVMNILSTKGLKTDIKSYKDQIESLQSKIDSTQTLNQLIGNKIDSVQSNVTEITSEIVNIDNNITTIKQKTNEKINSVDSFTTNELEQFFTDRYNKGQD